MPSSEMICMRYTERYCQFPNMILIEIILENSETDYIFAFLSIIKLVWKLENYIIHRNVDYYHHQNCQGEKNIIEASTETRGTPTLIFRGESQTLELNSVFEYQNFCCCLDAELKSGLVQD